MSKKSKAQSFYDRIADVHNLVMSVNGYRGSLAKCLRSIGLRIDENSLVLDAGCGTGVVTLGFYAAGFRPRKTFAVDLSLNSLKIAEEQFQTDEKTDDQNVCPVQANVLRLPFADETFDLIVSCGVLEYVSVEEGLCEFSRVLKKDAKLVLIPVRPSFVGSILEVLYKFKTHSVAETERIAGRYFEIDGNYKFHLTEPIGWSKQVFLWRKRK